MGKGTSVSHLPYTWDKMKPPKKVYKDDSQEATRRHKKPATSGMEQIVSTPAPERPFSNG